ncbi:hypothetical protein [Actinomadura violacea]|uniref:Uncharacterized protein n=1 Tax=Actinomadura violacea TaxID=2819934 RepID=A0ABS3RXX2_9ACTN|nr:hypothetical protein [Actinomadura violacea]MBO2461611.1 hypothetical protein [Actinomadura violacea]
MPVKTNAKQDKVAALSHRIDALTQIIDRPTTREEERDAARRALLRLRAKEKEQWEEAAQSSGYYQRPDGWAGAKYEPGKFMGATELAAAIRKDIALARKLGKQSRKAQAGALVKSGVVAVPYADPIGDAPDFIRIFVRRNIYSGGRSIDITIKNVPADWWVTKTAYWDDNVKYKDAGPELAALGQALKDLANAYNYDRSDIQTDYFDVNFYLHVVADGHGEGDYPQHFKTSDR